MVRQEHPAAVESGGGGNVRACRAGRNVDESIDLIGQNQGAESNGATSVGLRIGCGPLAQSERQGVVEPPGILLLSEGFKAGLAPLLDGNRQSVRTDDADFKRTE